MRIASWLRHPELDIVIRHNEHVDQQFLSVKYRKRLSRETHWAISDGQLKFSTYPRIRCSYRLLI